MTREYDRKIKEDAEQYGYKAANLIFLQNLIRDFKALDGAATEETLIQVPSFLPISNIMIVNHLNTHAPEWQILWQRFCETQGVGKDSVTEEAEAVLKELKRVIKNCFTTHKIELASVDLGAGIGAGGGAGIGAGAAESTFTGVGVGAGSTAGAAEGDSSEPEKIGALFMVRSTSNEDRVDVANPGGNKSVPSKVDDLSAAVGQVIASYFSSKSLNQRLKSKEDITSKPPLTACLIQNMVGESIDHTTRQTPISGVIYTDNGHIRIQSAPGHGELVVNCEGNFDSYYIDPHNVVFSEIMDKKFRLVPEYDAKTKRMKLSYRDNDFLLASNSGLDESTLLEMAKFARFVEAQYGMRMDIEFVYDPSNKSLNIVQARAIPEGDRAGLKPSALLPDFIADKKPETLKAAVITPDIISAVMITDPLQVLICETIQEALDIYLKNPTNSIKAVVIAHEAADTSHPAGMFTSKAIPVMHVADLTQARKMVEKLPDAKIVIDPQHSAIYSSNYISEESIGEGLFKSTLSPHVSTFVRSESLTKERVSRSLELLKKHHPKESYRSMQDIINDLDILAIPVFGEDNISHKEKLSHILSLTKKLTEKGKISKTLCQEIFITVDNLIDILEKINTNAEQDPNLLKHYLNIHQKLSGEILSQSKKDTLSSSMLRDMARVRAINPYITMARKADLSEEDKLIFLELVKLKKFFIEADKGDKWIEFCLDSCKLGQSHQLANMIKDLVKINLHEYWLNSEFLTKYEIDKNTTLLYLKEQLDSGRSDREELTKSAKVIDKIEHQISLWQEPRNFDKLHSQLRANIASVSNLLNTEKLTYINKRFAIQQLDQLIDSFDKSIKAVQNSLLYTDKTQQVQNFKTLLVLFTEFLDDFACKSETKYVDQYIRQLKERLDKLPLSPETLLPSAEFNVGKVNLYTKDYLSNFADKMVTLADFHTLIHQGLISSLQINSTESASQMERYLPDDVIKIMNLINKKGGDPFFLIANNEIINVRKRSLLASFPYRTPSYYEVENKYPSLHFKYNISLRGHSLKLDLEYNYVKKELIFNCEFNGIGGTKGNYKEFSRWFDLDLLATLLTPVFTEGKLISSEIKEQQTYDLKIAVAPELVKAKQVLDLIKSFCCMTMFCQYTSIRDFQDLQPFLKGDTDIINFCGAINRSLKLEVIIPLAEKVDANLLNWGVVRSSQLGNFELVEFFFEQNKDNYKSFDCTRILVSAIEFEHKDIIDYLFSNKLFLENVNFNEVLLHTLRNNNISVFNSTFSLFKDKITSINSSLAEALRLNDPFYIQMLVSEASDKITTEPIDNIFRSAITSKNLPFLEWFLSNKMNLINGTSTLCLAIEEKNKEYYDMIHSKLIDSKKPLDYQTIAAKAIFYVQNEFAIKILSEFAGEIESFDNLVKTGINNSNATLISYILDNYSHKITNPYDLISYALQNSNKEIINLAILALEPKISEAIKMDNVMQLKIKKHLPSYVFTYEREAAAAPTASDTAPAPSPTEPTTSVASAAPTVPATTAPTASLATAATAPTASLATAAPTAPAATAPSTSEDTAESKAKTLDKFRGIMINHTEIKVSLQKNLMLDTDKTAKKKSAKHSKASGKKGGKYGSCCPIL